jgi:hypothetical protein
MDRVAVELLKIIGRIEESILPIKTKPPNILLDRFLILDRFLARICIVKTKIAGTSVFRGYSKVETNGLCMSDMQIAVRFGWEPRCHTAPVLVGFKVIRNDGSDEINGWWRLWIDCLHSDKTKILA